MPSNDRAFDGIYVYQKLNAMKTKILALVLGALFTIPCVLRAEEVEIQLMEVIQMETFPGDAPLDDAEHMGQTPPRPRDFRATIDGNQLSILKQEATIPSAQAVVVNAATGSVVVNEPFATSLMKSIPTTGVYALRIQTIGGALVGQFIVQ